MLRRDRGPRGRAGDPRRDAAGDEDHGHAVRAGHRHRRGAGPGAASGKSAATAIPTTCSAKARAPAPMPHAICVAYLEAIDAIGKRAGAAAPVAAPGVSVKLSALHPRFELAQAGRVRAELVPRVLELAVAARAHNIGLTIDAEEADAARHHARGLRGRLLRPAAHGMGRLRPGRTGLPEGAHPR